MSRFDRPADVPVTIGACLCPGTPHDGGDIVYLAPELSAAGGMAAQAAISAATDDSTGAVDLLTLQEGLWRVYRDHGVVGWNLADEGGLVPLSSSNKDLALPYAKGGRKVADAADELYQEDVLTPFRERVAAIAKELERAARLQAGSTNATPKATSSTPTSIRKPRKPSSRRASATPTG